MTETGGDGRADNEDYQPETDPADALGQGSPAGWQPKSFESEDYLPEDTSPAEGEGDGDEVHTALPGKVEAWRRRSATGAVLTGFALGLQQVFETKKDEPAIIMETSGDPPRDLPVEADFEYGRPRSSVVNIRPWLLPGDEQGAEPKAGEPEAGDPQAAAPDQARTTDQAGDTHQAGAGDEGHQEGPES